MGQSIKVATKAGEKLLDLEACLGATLRFDGVEHELSGEQFLAAVRDYMNADLMFQAARDFQLSSRKRNAAADAAMYGVRPSSP